MSISYNDLIDGSDVFGIRQNRPSFYLYAQNSFNINKEITLYLTGWQLAFLEDRILMYNKKKQKYGTQAVWDNELKVNKIYPVKDFKNVDERRKEIGLETMEEYVTSNGYLMDQKE